MEQHPEKSSNTHKRSDHDITLRILKIYSMLPWKFLDYITFEDAENLFNVALEVSLAFSLI